MHGLPELRFSDPIAEVAVADVSARLDRLPFAGPIRRMVAIMALGCFFENYFLQMTAYIAPGMVRSGLLQAGSKGFFDSHTVGFFIFSGFMGMLAGSTAFGVLADRFGRRPMFVWAMVWYAGCGVAMAFQTTAGGLDAWRFLSSIGLGLELVTVNSYVSELVATRFRGRAIAFYQFVALLAVPLAALIATLLTPLSPLGIAGWRWVVIVGALAVPVVWAVRRGLPESPRWLAAVGRNEEAERIVTALEAAIERTNGASLPPAAPVSRNAPARAVRFGDLFRPPYTTRTLMFVIQQTFMPVAFFGFAAWVPTLLMAKGVTITHSLNYAFIIAIATPASPLLMMMFADRIERKWQIAGGALLSAVFILGFAMQTAPAAVIALGVLVTMSENVVTTAIANYMPECFPTAIRARGHGLVYGVSRVMAAASGPIVASTLVLGGIKGVAMLIGGGFLAVAAVTSLLGPRVQGRSLEEINVS